MWLSLAVTVLGFGGMFGAFTYIAYTLTEVSGFASGAVPWLLVLFGAGLVVGNWIGGRLADRSIDGTLLGFIAALVVVLALFAWLAPSPVATIVLLVAMGGFGFGTVPALQSRVMRYAAQRADARLGREHRRVQPRQRARRLGGRRRDRGRPRLHLADLGGRGHHGRGASSSWSSPRSTARRRARADAPDSPDARRHAPPRHPSPESRNLDPNPDQPHETEYP